MISVIIPVGDNRDANLDLCLYALRNQTYREFEVVIAADGDHGVTLCSDHLPITYYHRRRDRNNLGAVNRNVGVSLAKGDFLLFIDSDVVLNPRALEYYADDFNDFSQRAIAGPYHWCAPMNVCREDIDYWEVFAARAMELMGIPKKDLDPLGFEMNHNVGIDSRPCWQTDKDNLFCDYPKSLQLLTGNMGISRKVFQDAGGFSEELISGIDGEFGIRVCKTGHVFSFDSRCYGLHLYHDRSFNVNWKDTKEKLMAWHHSDTSWIGKMKIDWGRPW